VKISEFEYMGFVPKLDFSTEWRKHVQQKLKDAGFDLNKPVTEHASLESNHVIYTQED